MAENLRLVEVGAFFDVGLYEKLPPVPKKARDFVERRRTDDEPLLMALFPPRVGKMEEHGGDLARRLESRQGQSDVIGEDAAPFGEAEPREALVDEGRPFATDFEGDDADVGLGREPFEEKTTAPGPHFDLET